MNTKVNVQLGREKEHRRKFSILTSLNEITICLQDTRKLFIIKKKKKLEFSFCVCIYYLNLCLPLTPYQSGVWTIASNYWRVRLHIISYMSSGKSGWVFDFACRELFRKWQSNQFSSSVIWRKANTIRKSLNARWKL